MAGETNHRRGGEDRKDLSRRGFLGAAAAGLAVGAAAPWNRLAHAHDIGPTTDEVRRRQAYDLRVEVAGAERDIPIPPHPTNGDEQRYPSKIGNYTKGLPHDGYGEVDPDAYEAMKQALKSGQQGAFDALGLGCPAGQQIKLVDPLSGLAFDLEGTDSHQLAIPPAPAFAGAEQAGEMVELYWMALLRDVPFSDYASSPLAQAAAADLSRLSDFQGPTAGGEVTPDLLFRGVLPGALVGPYVSQLRYLAAPFAASYIEQRITTAATGVDFMTGYADWLAVQNGCEPSRSPVLLPDPRYIVDGRDFASWVHLDVSVDTYISAFFVLRALGVPFNDGNPYNPSHTEEGFGTFGYPHGLSLLAEVVTRGLKAMWYQKWFVHRRERPEDFGGRVELDLKGTRQYPIDDDLLCSGVLDAVFTANAEANGGEGTYLLPQAYPEGSPLHPSYGQGHGVMAGACVTILKAFFDATYVIEQPVVPRRHDPSKLEPCQGPELTIAGELDKLASNIAQARGFAGVHFRSDGQAALLLGEEVAISVLRDQKPTCAEDFAGFTFTRFDGTTITV